MVQPHCRTWVVVTTAGFLWWAGVWHGCAAQPQQQDVIGDQLIDDLLLNDDDDVWDLDDCAGDGIGSSENVVQANVGDVTPEEPVVVDDDVVMEEVTVVLDDDTDENATERSTPDQNVAPSLPEEGASDESSSSSSGTITVKSNLEDMSDEALQAICLERGFDLAATEGQQQQQQRALTHEDYVEGAKRCLSLENEMNAILAENPDLAAELEDEIERMATEKDRLMAERDAMMAEKAELERKLRASGVDVPESPPGQEPTGVDMVNSSSDVPDTLEETLHTAFTMLFDRVGQDFWFVCKMLGYVVRPMGDGVQLVWRYTGPTVENGLKRGLDVSEAALSAPQLVQARRILSETIARSLTVAHIALIKARKVGASAIVQLDKRKEFRMVHGIVVAFAGPLRDSLKQGIAGASPWMIRAASHTKIWFERLKNERQSQDIGQQIKKKMS